MSEREFIHKRDLPGIKSRYLLEWDGEPINGAYIIEHTLISNQSGSGFSILLIPGIFDPVRGEYGPETIEALLQNPDISTVYEPHFYFNDSCGLLDMDSINETLCLMFTKSNQPVLAIGLSGGCTAICSALYELHHQGIKPALRGALLIGPHLSDYPTFFIKAIRKLMFSEDMIAKVTQHAGHPNIPANVKKGEAWLAECPFTEAMGQLSLKQQRPGFPVKIETRYFRFDTLSKEGRKRLHWYFDCPKPKATIPGHHRGLFRVLEAKQIICDFCSENSSPLNDL